ncbi:MAG: hypothetical protein QOK30_837 [Nocardioidaceae bacterium]|nr:hypothetical protein [Nocardioidaceae bacterium]
MSRRAGGDVARLWVALHVRGWPARVVLDHERPTLRSPGVARTPASAIEPRAGCGAHPARRSGGRRVRGGRRRCPFGRQALLGRAGATPSRQECGGSGASLRGRSVHRGRPSYPRDTPGGRRDPRRRLVAARSGPTAVSGGSRARRRARVRGTVGSHGPTAAALSPYAPARSPSISALSAGHLCPLDRASLAARPNISARSARRCSGGIGCLGWPTSGLQEKRRASRERYARCSPECDATSSGWSISSR